MSNRNTRANSGSAPATPSRTAAIPAPPLTRTLAMAFPPVLGTEEWRSLLPETTERDRPCRKTLDLHFREMGQFVRSHQRFQGVGLLRFGPTEPDQDQGSTRVLPAPRSRPPQFLDPPFLFVPGEGLPGEGHVLRRVSRLTKYLANRCRSAVAGSRWTAVGGRRRSRPRWARRTLGIAHGTPGRRFKGTVLPGCGSAPPPASQTAGYSAASSRDSATRTVRILAGCGTAASRRRKSHRARFSHEGSNSPR